MMKYFIEYIIRLRNPRFTFDREISGGEIRQFSMQKAWMMLRACRLWLHGRKTHFMMLGRGVHFFNLKKIRFGKLVKLDDHVFISALGKDGVNIGDYSGIGAFSRIVVSTTLNDTGLFIRIGNHVGMGEFAYLGGAGGLEIGDHCIIGQYFSCHPENHVYENPEMLIRMQGVKRKGIKIGADCWIGSKVTVLDGVIIGEGCVIAAGSVVTRSIPPYSVVAGVPARVIRDRRAIPEDNIIPLKSING